MQSGVRAFSQKLAKHRWFGLAVAFIAGAALMYVVVGLTNSDNTKTSTKTPKSPQRSATAVAYTQERLDSDYKRVKQHIVEEVAAEHLTNTQADQLSKKLDEAYTYRKSLKAQTVEERRALLKHRAEWRQWAIDHKIPDSYFTWLY